MAGGATAMAAPGGDRHPREGLFDLVRFLAASAVFAYHHAYTAMLLDHFSPLSAPALVPWAKYGYLGVDVFFIISGYFILLSADGRTWSGFITARCARLYPAFAICCVCTFIAKHWFGDFPPEWDVSWTDLGRNLALTHFLPPGAWAGNPVDVVYWTLRHELAWYLIVMAWLVWRPVRQADHLLLALAALFPVLWLLSAQHEILTRLCLGGYLCHFLFGGLLYHAGRHGWTTVRATLAIYLLTWIGLKITADAAMKTQDGEPIQPAIAIAVVLSFAALFTAHSLRPIAVGGRLVAVLGGMTYAFYLIHHHLGVVIAQHCPWLRGTSGVLLLYGFFVVVAGAFSATVEPRLIRGLRGRLRRWFSLERAATTAVPPAAPTIFR